MQWTEVFYRDTILRILVVLIMTVCFSWAISTITVNEKIDRKIRLASPCSGLTTAECAYKLLKALPASQRKELGITERRIQRLKVQAHNERRLANQRQQRAVQAPTSGTTPLPQRTVRHTPTTNSRPQSHSTAPSPLNSHPSPPTPPASPASSNPIVSTPTIKVPATPVTPTVTIPSVCVPSC